VTDDDVVGREPELAALSTLLAPGEGTRVAVVTGAPGSGKSTLVDVIAGRAADAGALLLTARPRETERSLSFSVLADLLDGLLADAGGRVPAQQAEVLRRAAVAEDTAVTEPRALAVAVRTALLTAATQRRVLVVIDDAHWADEASLVVLPHAVRRLEPAPVSLLVATRPVDAVNAVDPWPADRVDVPLTGLSAAALFRLVRSRLGVVLGRGDLGRLEKASHGNPLYALELARAWADGVDDPAVLTPSLEQLVRRHVRQLPAAVRRVLLVAALAHDPTPDVLAAAAGIDRPALEAAVATARPLAAVAGGRLGFDHPLHAAAVVADAGADDRRDVHRRLAEVEGGLEVVARHRALADVGPDADTAQLLTRAAHQARSRGAHATARELARLAVTATPPGHSEDAERRLLLGAWALHDGDPQTCAEMVTPLSEVTGPVRARAHLLLARRALISETAESTRAHVDVALSSLDPVVRASALLVLAEVDDDVAMGRESARRVLAELEAVDGVADPVDVGRQRTAAVTAVALRDLLLRQPEALDRLVHAAALEEQYPPEDALSSARFALAQQLMFASRLTEARTILTTLIAEARELGDEASEPTLLLNLGHLEVRAGRLQQAGWLAREGLDRAELTGQGAALVLGRLQVAADDARTGADELAQAAVDQAVAAADAVGDPWLAAIARAVHGRICLTRGDVERAVGPLTELVGLGERAGLVDTGWNPSPADLAESLAVLGDAEGAEAELVRLLAGVVGLDRPHVHAAVPRARALARTAQHGADQEALELALAAVGEHERLGLRFELGHSLLVAGVLHRRARQKGAAHRLLVRAVEVFAECSAPRWAGRASAELARVGLRPSAPASLTETELRIARLAVAGRTNKQIATEVFLSQKTVEAVLGRVYRKLGVRSRVELVSALPD
jgi:DNA-binding CsgD family transcriptional regulator